MSTAAAIILFAAVTMYAIFGGADFGAGFWDLTAGGAQLDSDRAKSSTTRSARSGKRTMCG
jgi:cytochrome bd-type quinol oxidase subunit 2